MNFSKRDALHGHRGQRDGAETGGANCLGLEQANDEPNAYSDGAHRRIADPQHKEEEPVGGTICDGTASATAAPDE